MIRAAAATCDARHQALAVAVEQWLDGLRAITGEPAPAPPEPRRPDFRVVAHVPNRICATYRANHTEEIAA